MFYLLTYTYRFFEILLFPNTDINYLQTVLFLAQPLKYLRLTGIRTLYFATQ
jgi:hypothetical protein